MKLYIIAILFLMLGMILGSILIIYKCGYILEAKEYEKNKFKTYYRWLDKWLEKKENGVLSFENLDVEKIAIYGKGKIGKHIEYELEKAGFKVQFYIDEFADKEKNGKDIYTLKDEWPTIDLIIITVANEFSIIRDKIEKKDKKIKIISMEELI